MLKLYSYNNSICTQKVFITFAEKGIAYETQNVDLFANEQFQPWYLKIHPKGVVPALDHDGAIVIESSLICEYLDDVFPSPRLVPAEPYARARMRLWSKAVDEGLFAATRELSFSAMFRDKMRHMTEEQREGRFRNVGDPVKRAHFMSTYAEGVESPYVFEGIAAYETAFGKMEKDLGGGLLAGRSRASPDAQPWLVGPDMTLADINMMPFVARLSFLELLDVWTAERPAVQAWWARVQSLASFKAAIPAKMTDVDFATMKTSGARIRARVAERRADYLRLPKAAA